jgi:hypothetical protein
MHLVAISFAALRSAPEPSIQSIVSDDLEVIRAPEALGALEGDWSRLSGHPEQNWELYWNSLRNRTPAPSPYVVALRNENRLEAALAGVVEPGQVVLKLGYWKVLRIPVRRIVLPGWGILGRADEPTARRLLDRVVADLRAGRADLAVLDFVEEGSPLHRAAKGYPLGFRMRDRVPERRVHWYLELPATFEEYHRKHKGLMQKVRKFEKAYQGRFEYRLLTREDEIGAFCDGADAVVGKTYQRALGVGFLNSAEDRGRIAAAARQGLWRAFVALVDGKVIAFWSGAQHGPTASLWWTGYDAEYQAYSPGQVASTRMVEAFIARGVSVMDFGGGDAPYKERLASSSRTEESICVFAPTLRGTVAHLVRAMDAAIANLVRTRLKGIAGWVKTRWRRVMAKGMSSAAEGSAGPAEGSATRRDGEGAAEPAGEGRSRPEAGQGHGRPRAGEHTA